MRKLLKVSILVTILMVLGVSVANADTLTYHGVTFDLQVSGNQVTMTVDGSGCNFVANCANNIYLGTVTIKAYSSFTGIVSSGVTQNGVTDTNYSAAALGNLGGSGCGLQANGFLCFAASSGSKLADGKLVFTATVTDPQLLALLSGATFSVQAEFYDSSTLIRTGRSNTFVAQMSESVPRVPEPASLSFLAIGVGGFALSRFRRK